MNVARLRGLAWPRMLSNMLEHFSASSRFRRGGFTLLWLSLFFAPFISSVSHSSLLACWSE